MTELARDLALSVLKNSVEPINSPLLANGDRDRLSAPFITLHLSVDVSCPSMMPALNLGDF